MKFFMLRLFCVSNANVFGSCDCRLDTCAILALVVMQMRGAGRQYCDIHLPYGSAWITCWLQFLILIWFCCDIMELVLLVVQMVYGYWDGYCDVG